MSNSKTGKPAQTLLDRVVGYVSPTAGLRRMQAKARLRVAMNYDAASKGRRTFGWRSPGSSADAAGQAMGARTQLRFLARDFVRNRPYASRGQSVITGNVVATGIMPSVDIEDAERKKLIDLTIREHLLTAAIDAAGIHNLPSMQRVSMNAVVEDGEMLVRRRWRLGGYANGLHLPFQVELLEADHLDPWKTSHGQNEVIDGVEFGPTGRAVAYHLFPQHPGSVWRKIRMESVRVPAADIIHVRRVDRPGQVRGVSWFAPVMMTLGDLSDYQEGEILKQKVAALMAGFLESEVVTDGEIAAKSPEEEAEDAGLGEIGPGTLTELPPGTTVKFTEPPNVNGYSPFMRQTLASIAMGLGITYEALAGDLSGVNFSSARMGRMEMDRNIETWQQLIMIDQFCRGIERWFKEAWVLKPKLGPADFSLAWTAPRRPLIDPTKEVPAMIKEVNAGLTSRQRAQRQLGRDPDVIEREISEDNGRTRPAGPEPTQTGGQLNGK